MDAVFHIFSLPVYSYGLYIALALAVSMLLYFFLCRKSDLFYASSLPIVLLGLLFARLFFCLFDPNFHEIFSLKNMFLLTTGGFSMFGAIIGACLAQLLAAKRMHIRPAAALDKLVLPLLLFVIPARLGENGTGLGLSRPLPLAVKDSVFVLNESYGSFINTWLLEALSAALLFVCFSLLYRKKQKEGTLFVQFLILFGLSQVLMESLRYDGHMRFSFISVQQIFAVLFGLLPLLFLSVRLILQKRHKFLACIGIFFVIIIPVAGLFLEFKIDRSTTSKLLLYGIYTALLALPAAAGLTILRKVQDHHG